jgi:hypothetical protein
MDSGRLGGRKKGCVVKENNPLAMICGMLGAGFLLAGLFVPIIDITLLGSKSLWTLAASLRSDHIFASFNTIFRNFLAVSPIALVGAALFAFYLSQVQRFRSLGMILVVPDLIFIAWGIWAQTLKFNTYKIIRIGLSPILKISLEWGLLLLIIGLVLLHASVAVAKNAIQKSSNDRETSSLN